MKAIICISRTKYKRKNLIVIPLGMYDKKNRSVSGRSLALDIILARMRAEKWAPITVAPEFC